MTVKERDVEKAFIGEPDGFLPTADRRVRSERMLVGKVLGRGDIPHLGTLAEEDHFRHLCRLVHLRRLEHPGPTAWIDALEKTRKYAWRELLDAEEFGDAYDRAFAVSQRKATARFLKQTEHLTQEG
jgi:hypothetical protein